MSIKIILTDEQLDSIHSLRDYLNTASQFPVLFKKIMNKNISPDIREMIALPQFFPLGASILFSWLGLLNCVVEGWLALGLSDNTIDSLIGTKTNRSNQAKVLNDFRHTVFHFQRQNRPIFMDFPYDYDLLEWAIKLNLEFEKWFDYYFTANTLPKGDPSYEWFKIAGDTKPFPN